jgi:TonB family protein
MEHTMNKMSAPSNRLHMRVGCIAAVTLIVLLCTYSVALAQQSKQGAKPSTGFTLTRRVTEYDDKGTAFPSTEETIYFSSSGDRRFVENYPNGQVVEIINLCGRGTYFHDHKNNKSVKFSYRGCCPPKPTTAEVLKADPRFVGTEYVLDRLAYLQRTEIEGFIEENYLTPETGPFPIKRISYYDGYKLVEEPLNITFGEPDIAVLNEADYKLIEQSPPHAGDLANRVQDQPTPEYPERAKALGFSGLVEIEVIVDETGQVINAIALSGRPLLREAAIEAAYRASILPVVKDGKPIMVKGYLNYQFQTQTDLADMAVGETRNQ